MVAIRVYAHADFPAALHWQALGFMHTEWPELDGPVLRDERLVAEHAPEHVVAMDGAGWSAMPRWCAPASSTPGPSSTCAA